MTTIPTDRRTGDDLLPYGMLLLASLVFASNHIISRQLHGAVPPMGMVFWRMIIASLILLPFIARDLRVQWPLVVKHWRLFLILGVAFVPLGNGLIYLAYNWTTAMNGGVVSTAQPAMTVILSLVLFRDTINTKQTTGLLLAAAGVLVILSRGDPAVLLSLEPNPGDVWLLAGVAFAALHNVLLRRVPAAISVPVLLLAIQFAGAVLTLPAYVAETIWYKPVPVTWEALSALAWMGAGVSVLAVGLNNAAVRTLGANKASLGNYLRSMFTAILAIVILGEAFLAYHAVAFALVVAGVLLMTRGRSIGSGAAASTAGKRGT